MASDFEQGILIGENSGVEDANQSEQAAIERRNLLNLTKLSVKVLIETTMKKAQQLDDQNPQLQQLLIVLEHCLKHRMKVRRSLLGQKRSFWAVLENLERSSYDFMETISNTRNIPGIKTALGRGRAWLRISLMHKKLADHFRTISEDRTTLNEWYEMDSIMLSEECTVVISGLMMGLNVIDYSMSLSADDFDRSPGVLNLSLFLRDGNYLEKAPEVDEGEEPSDEEKSLQLAQLLDQKAYLEELNKKLE
jgi:RUN and FYVE domain-containing protein 1